MDAKKLKFAVNFVLSNVDTDMLDDFIDHRWCVKDWEDLRDELEGKKWPDTSEGHVGSADSRLSPKPIDVMPNPIEVANLQTLGAALDSVFAAMSSSELQERADGWGDDFTQFVRLLANCDEVGLFDELFNDRDRIGRLCSNMDLSEADIVSLIVRAKRSWNVIKKGV